MEIKLHIYDYDKKETIENGSVDTGSVAKALNTKQLADLLDHYVNSYDSASTRGIEVGAHMANTHRTLQNNFVHLVLGMLIGYTKFNTGSDARNEQALDVANEMVNYLCQYSEFFHWVYDQAKPPKED